MIDPKTQQDLGWQQLLAVLVDRCRTRRGAELLRSLDVFLDIEDAQRHAVEVSEARAMAEGGAALPFGGITDVMEILARAAPGGALAADELIDTARTALGCARLKTHIEARANTAPRLAAVADDIVDLSTVFEPIAAAFEPDGTLADHASPDLGRLRRSAARLATELEQRARQLASDPRLQPHLQDAYVTQRDERYVLPIKLASQSRVRGIVHGTSQSGQTLFIEPEEIVGLNNKLKMAQCDVADEERRILVAFTRQVSEAAAPLRDGIDAATYLDRVATIAEISSALNATEPVFNGDGNLDLRSARHPLMELAQRPCVPNNIALAPRRIMVISGPNAGGKTVVLKTVGLAALMARAGMHIAVAPGSTLPWYRDVLTDIGDSQSLEHDLSTFSAHLLKLNRFLVEADERTLLLIDEVAVGTDPDQGAALAQAVLETLAGRGVPVLVTTHYEPLKALGANTEAFCNASVGFDMDAMAPTFRLHLDVPGSSGALEVARRLGLHADVADRATVLLGEGRARIDELLNSLGHTRDKLALERSELAGLLADAREAHRRAVERETKARESAHDEAVAALRDARVTLDRAKISIRKRVKAEQLAKDAAAIDGASKVVRQHAPAAPRPEGRPASEQDLCLGAAVIVTGLGKRGRGTVVEPPRRGKVVVQVGAMRTTISISELVMDVTRAPQSSANTQRSSNKNVGLRLARADDDDAVSVRTSDATLDVRGERVDDALGTLDRFLDQNVLASREVVWVIHGHGTGALRRAIREHLSAHSQVAKLRAGERNEGGDGVTVVALCP